MHLLQIYIRLVIVHVDMSVAFVTVLSILSSLPISSALDDLSKFSFPGL